MCSTSRRDFLSLSAGLVVVAETEERARANKAYVDVNQVTKLADSVYFHEGDIQSKGHCNNGWIIFDDYVLVVDANFPSGALEVIPKIRALTEKPIRFAFDTHHHGDHAYGNQVWVDNGAVVVAHTGVIEDMKKYETGYYGSKPGRWEEAAGNRQDVKESKLSPPTVLFPKELFFQDRKRRMELVHLGVAHTHGDAWAWLPAERILFTGDACVNGAYNYTNDGNVEQWIKTLDAAKKLGARIICPGHGAWGQSGLIDDQRKFFSSLRDKVGALIRVNSDPSVVNGGLEGVKKSLQSDPQIARYVGDGFTAQAGKVYHEMTGKVLSGTDVKEARNWHAHQHGKAAFA